MAIRFFAFLVSTAWLTAAAATDCTTPTGVPCMVVESVQEQWSVLNRGFNYSHSRWHQQIAYASNGSLLNEYRFEEIPLIGKSEVSATTTQLYVGPTDRVVRIMHGDRQFSNREPIIWHDRPYRRAKADDRTCASGILHIGTDFHRDGEETILGMQTYRWYRPLDYGGYEEYFLAPAADCAALRSTRVQNNFVRIPVFMTRGQVNSIRFGEPDRKLFDIPAGYKEVPDPSAERLRRFVEANRSRLPTPSK